MGLKGWGWIGLMLVGLLLAREVRAAERQPFAESETLRKGLVEVPATVSRVSVEVGTVEKRGYWYNGSIYYVHSFEGTARQQIAIELTSEAFHPILLVLDPNGNLIAVNDDDSEEYDAAVVVVLPVSGVYEVVVTTNNKNDNVLFDERGAYHLAWRAASETEAQKAEADFLLDVGIEQHQASQFREAIQSWQMALDLYQDIGSRSGEAASIGNLGLSYLSLGEYNHAIDLYQQSLTINREIGDQQGEANSLNYLGIAHFSLGDYNRAVEFHKQFLSIAHDLGDRQGKANALNNLALSYFSLGEYNHAISLYKQSLAIFQDFELQWRESEAKLILDYNRPITLYQQFLHYEQSLAVFRDLGHRRRENLQFPIPFPRGLAFRSVGGYYNQIISFFYSSQLFFAFSRERSVRRGEAVVLSNLGNVYRYLDEYERAIKLYRESLDLFRDLNDREGVASGLNNIANTLSVQNQPEQAIAFYKQSVNTYETIRQDLQGLPRTQQESYTEKVADTYRNLADLLLAQGRVLEAQQVLDLLKLQEVRDFLNDQRAGGSTDGIALLPIEADLIEAYETLVDFAKTLDDCAANDNCTEYSALEAQMSTLEDQYRAAVTTLETAIRQRLDRNDPILNPTELPRTAREIVAAQPGTVLVYPFVLEDKLWLLWATEGGILGRREVPVTQRELGTVAVELRQLLEDPTSDLAELQAKSQQLYEWLIAPLEAELDAGAIQHLVFALDRVTRYLPMAVLHDGEQYLIEKYSVTTILSALLTDTDDRLTPGTDNNPILGFGLSDAVPGFDPLPHVSDELDAIVLEDGEERGIYPGTPFLNGDFTLDTLQRQLRSQSPRLLHIATHAEFVPGDRDRSFLALGDGQQLPIPRIEDLQKHMENLHLVVLSACETALGGATAEGLEIAGLSYYFLGGRTEGGADLGASAVLATLWKVSDRSTSEFMQQFYANLADVSSAGVTKAEALRQAQLRFIRGELTAEEGVERAPIEPRDAEPVRSSVGYAHPYYWSPFVLIGNGL